MKLKLVVLGLVLGVLAFAPVARAAEIVCPGSPVYGDPTRQFYLDTDPVSSCLAYGTGPNDVKGTDDVITALGYTFLDKDEAGDQDSAHEGWLTLPDIDWGNSTSGTFTIDPAAWLAYNTLVIAFKVGNVDPIWAAFELGDNVLGGEWWTLPTRAGGMSHVVLYGKDASVVPEPASMLLLGTGLLGAGVFRRRRR